MQAGAAHWMSGYRAEPAPGFYGLVSRSLLGTLLLVGMTLLTLWRFLGPRASLSSGFVAVVGMKVAAETFQRVYAVHHQDFYQGGALLVGAVIGETYARFVGVRPEGSYGEELEARRFGMTGALGMFAGSYMAAGASKVLGGGLSWATSSAVRLMILSHAEVDGPTWLAAIPHWTASNPYVCMALEVGTLVIQLGAFMLVLGPLARRVWAFCIVAFHTGIFLTSSILFVSPMLFAAVVAVPWRRVFRRQPDPDDPGEENQELARPAGRRGALVLCLLGAVVVLRLTKGW